MLTPRKFATKFYVVRAIMTKKKKNACQGNGVIFGGFL